MANLSWTLFLRVDMDSLCPIKNKKTRVTGTRHRVHSSPTWLREAHSSGAYSLEDLIANVS